MKKYLFLLLLFVLSGTAVAAEKEASAHFVRKCPECGEHVFQPVVFADNTDDVTFWTDGKVEVPTLPDCPMMVKCPKCLKFFWIDEAEKLPELPDKPPVKYRNYLAPTEAEYYQILNAGGLPLKKEIYLRFRAWHAMNDRWRARKDAVPTMSTEEEANLTRLYSLLREKNDGETIVKAEIARELGNFRDALMLLERKFDPRLNGVVGFIKKLCQEQKRTVAEIDGELLRFNNSRFKVNSWLEVSIWCILGVAMCFFGIHSARKDKKSSTITYDFSNTSIGKEDKQNS